MDAEAGSIFYTVGFLGALILWSFGLVWLFFALASIVRSKTFPFNIGWWGFTFPLGVFATCTCEMGMELPSKFFRILGTVSHTLHTEVVTGVQGLMNRWCRCAWWCCGQW